ncbi:hypothetical protein [Streptomyces sp. NPDC053367]|uniref:hypothetical protein n=1 Tax=Streptomyces sp. NPDC053367 TaxID=3365700 RepID=UPI0037D7CCF1
MTATTPEDWALALSIALILCGTTGAVALLLIDLDPRPACRRVHQVVVDAGHTVNRATATAERLSRLIACEAAVTATALLFLLSSPEATR